MRPLAPQSSQPYFLRSGLPVRRVRELNGLSQIRLAQRAGVNLSYVCTLENHPCNISIRKLSDICNALFFSMSNLGMIMDQEAKAGIVAQSLARATEQPSGSASAASGLLIADEDRLDA